MKNIIKNTDIDRVTLPKNIINQIQTTNIVLKALMFDAKKGVTIINLNIQNN